MLAGEKSLREEQEKGKTKGRQSEGEEEPGVAKKAQKRPREIEESTLQLRWLQVVAPGACLDEVDPAPFRREVGEAKRLVEQAAKPKPAQDGRTTTVWWQQSEKSRADE
jgi:hypothetical protein